MRFIVAVDGSDQSERALDHALDLAASMRDSAGVTVVHSVDPDVYAGDGLAESASVAQTDQHLVVESVEDAERRGMEVLEDAEAVATERDVTVETELLYGDPVDTLPEFASAGEFDGLFVGHRGLDERYERVLGSTAKQLVERMPIPVTVVS